MTIQINLTLDDVTVADGLETTITATRSTDFGQPVNISFGFDIHELLAQLDRIAIVWCVEDVIAVRPHLTTSQAMQVLEHAKRNHDAGEGMSWGTLQYVADILFGASESPTDGEGVDHD